MLTGDIQGDPRAPAKIVAQALSSVSVQGPRLAVLGNRDSVAMVEALETLDFEVLVNRSIILERDNHRLRITGLDDVHCFYTEEALTALHEHGDDMSDSSPFTLRRWPTTRMPRVTGCICAATLTAGRFVCQVAGRS